MVLLYDPHSTTGDTPYQLTYGMEAVIPLEIEEMTRGQLTHFLRKLMSPLREKINLLEENKMSAAFSSAILKQTTTAKYNFHVRHKGFQSGKLVLQKASIRGKNAQDGKLATNWEGSYWMKENTRVRSVFIRVSWRRANTKDMEHSQTEIVL